MHVSLYYVILVHQSGCPGTGLKWLWPWMTMTKEHARKSNEWKMRGKWQLCASGKTLNTRITDTEKKWEETKYYKLQIHFSCAHFCHWLPCCYTSTKSWRGYIFTTVCLCVCVCVCVCVSVCVCVQFPCEQNSSRTDAPIWTRFSLNGCL